MSLQMFSSLECSITLDTLEDLASLSVCSSLVPLQVRPVGVPPQALITLKHDLDLVLFLLLLFSFLLSRVVVVHHVQGSH